jgi:hypothetical protein
VTAAEWHDEELEAALRPVFEELVTLREEVVILRDQVTCPRCSTEAPPLPRWPGDPRATDTRRPHTCNRPNRWDP